MIYYSKSKTLLLRLNFWINRARVGLFTKFPTLYPSKEYAQRFFSRKMNENEPSAHKFYHIKCCCCSQFDIVDKKTLSQALNNNANSFLCIVCSNIEMLNAIKGCGFVPNKKWLKANNYLHIGKYLIIKKYPLINH